MEVLISIFVLSVGLLGLAALIPVGSFALMETGKADRAGACGRAALREIKVRRLVDPQYWSNPNASLDGGAVALDPVGVSAGMGSNLGLVPRLTFQGINDTLLQEIFFWSDDLQVKLPPDVTERPRIQFYQADGSMSGTPTPFPVSEGHYSWLMTVTPTPGEVVLLPGQRSTYHVSVAVCYRRQFGNAGQQETQVAQFLSQGIGGGSVRLGNRVEVKENQWIMLCGQRPGPTGNARPICHWYRVVMAGESPTDLLTLAGPDWDPAYPATAVIINSVIGVYSTVVELDRDPKWRRAW